MTNETNDSTKVETKTKDEQEKNDALAAVANGSQVGLVPINDEGSALVVSTMRSFEELGLSPFKLNSINVPGGGSLRWVIETLEGEEDYVAEITGVCALVARGQRAWFRTPYEESGGGSPPDCSSEDGIEGFGVRSLDGDADEPSVQACSTCRWDRFGSTRGSGSGKDCVEKMRMYIYREGMLLPDVVNVSPGSLDTVMTWAGKLLARGLAPDRVVVKLTLEKATSQTGIEFARVKPSVVRVLTDEEHAAFAPVTASVREYVARSKSALPTTSEGDIDD